MTVVSALPDRSSAERKCGLRIIAFVKNTRANATSPSERLRTSICEQAGDFVVIGRRRGGGRWMWRATDAVLAGASGL